jgi:hypothetical protein
MFFFKFIKSSFQYDILSELKISKPTAIKITRIVKKDNSKDNKKRCERLCLAV